VTDPRGDSGRAEADVGGDRLAEYLRQRLPDATGPLTIEPPDRPRDFRVARGRRIGITRARALALRFWIEGDPHVSR
jgi:3-methyladenine DNA glycosylase Mpg